MRESKNSTKKFGLKQWFAGLLALLMIVTALPVNGLFGVLTAKAAEADTVDVYRAYNQYSYGHLWTTDANEYTIITTAPQGWNAEGVAWKAPKTSSTPVYRLFNPNTDEHLLALASEAAALTGWNNEGIAFYSDDAKGVPIYRVNNPNEDGPASHHFCDLAEGTALVAKGYKWDNNGQPMIYGVVDEEDQSNVVSLVDKSGLQDDGTALVTDTLAITYGSSFGTPYAVTWYVNGAVVDVAYAGGTASLLEQEATATFIGQVYAIVENTKGVREKTNTITVSAKEEPVTLSGFALSEDYDTFANLTFDTTSENYVAEVTLSKDVKGKFYIVKDDVTSYVTASTVGNGAALDAETFNGGKAEHYKTVTDASDATDKKVIANVIADYTTNTTEHAFKIKNADGSVTYRFEVPTTGLTRGSSYQLIFDQTAIDTDTITANAATAKASPTTAKPNITKAVTADYLKAPASIAVTSRKDGNKPEVTVYGKDGAVLSYFGDDTAGTALSSLGASDFEVYECTGSAKTSGTKNASIGTASLAKAGVIEGNAVLAQAQYYYAKLVLKKGIFAEDKIELESNIVEGSDVIAKSLKVEADATTPTTAKITLDTVRAAGTLYVLKDGSSTGELAIATAKTATADQIKAAALGSVAVEKGDTEKTIASVIAKAGDYYAVLIPEDTETYVMMVDGKATGPASGAVNTIAQKATSVKVGDDPLTALPSSTNLVVKGLIAYDQYGDKMTTGNGTTAYTAAVTPINTLAAHTEASTASYTITATTGLVVLTLTDSSAAGNQHDKGDGFKVDVLGTELEITNSDDAAVWTIDKVSIKVNGSAAIVKQVATTLGTGTNPDSDKKVAGTIATSSATMDNITTCNAVFDQFGDVMEVASTQNTTVKVYTDAALSADSGVNIEFAWTSSGTASYTSSKTGATIKTDNDLSADPTWYASILDCVMTITVDID